MIKQTLAFSLSDTKNILRDSTLLLMAFGTLGILLILRFGVPTLGAFLFQQYNFKLDVYYPYIVCFMGFVPPLLFGMISGFIILEERDQEIITFISITPLGKTGYIAYKMIFSMLTGFIFYFLIIYSTGLLTLPLMQTTALAAGAMFIAPVTALILAAFAENKVQGLALAKITGIQLLAPLAVFFVPGHWKYIAALLPTFWLTKAFLAVISHQHSFVIFILIGYLLYLIFLIIFMKCFTSRQR